MACLLASTMAFSIPLAGAQEAAATERVVQLHPFEDTLFASLEPVRRVAFDEEGDVWLTGEGGLLHVDFAHGTRRLWTRQDGLPTSYATGLAVSPERVFVGTDLGLAVLDRATARIDVVTSTTSPLPDAIVTELALLGDVLWIGTYAHGVSTWNVTSGAWSHFNTSADGSAPRPITRLSASGGAVWIATDGDGLWRASGTGTLHLSGEAGLPQQALSAVLEWDGYVYAGSGKGLHRRALSGGLWTTWNATMGLPHDLVLDLEAVPNQAGGFDVWAATHEGFFQLDPGTLAHRTHTQASFGHMGRSLRDVSFDPGFGWVIATELGLSVHRGDAWRHFATGPTLGASPGPQTTRFSAAGIDNPEGLLWFGGAEGISAFRPASGEGPARWFNFGAWAGYEGGQVTFLDTAGNVTWLATTQGVWGYDRATETWIDRRVDPSMSRNLVYAVGVDRDELWIPLFCEGLVMEDLRTGETRVWTPTSAVPLLDPCLTDLRIQGDEVWLGAQQGVLRLDRASGTFTGVYTRHQGLPGAGVVYRLLPDGPVVWVGTQAAGLARLDTATGTVTRVWNATTSPGWPAGQTRSLLRVGADLWVGTTEGLARLDVRTGEFRVYDASDPGLVQTRVNGLAHADGVLYAATLSGIARLDLATDTFLPMHERLPEGSNSAPAPRDLRVRIDQPQDGASVWGPIALSGTASVEGVEIDRVEWRLDEGHWQDADGTREWRATWDSTTAQTDAPVLLSVRAFAGNLTRSASVLVRPIALPATPLTLEALAPDPARAGRPIRLGAMATGEEPLSVALYYRPAGSEVPLRIPLARQGSLFTATLPASDAQEGILDHWFEATSPHGKVRAPESGTFQLQVRPVPRLAVAIETPESLVARAGQRTSLPIAIANEGNEPGNFTLHATGLRAAWLSLPAHPVHLEPGARTQVDAIVAVPEGAFDDETQLILEARDETGRADPATARVPLRVESAGPPTPSPEAVAPKAGIPAGTPFGALLLAVLGRRWLR